MNNESTPQKCCSKCGETKPLDAFSKYKRSKDGYKTQCKACINAYNAVNPERSRERSRTHYAANRESILTKQRIANVANPDKKREKNRAYRTKHADRKREIDRNYRLNNPDKVKARKRAYYEANAESIREKTRAYNAANPEKKREMDLNYRTQNAEKIRAQRQKNAAIIREWKRDYRAKHADEIREFMRQWRAANQDQIRAYRNANLDLFRAACQKRRARIKGNGGSFTSQQLHHMRLTQGGFCAYCQRQHDPDELTIDHIIPIDQGGRHEAANICLACRHCNCSKNNRTPDQWVNRWYWRKRND